MGKPKHNIKSQTPRNCGVDGRALDAITAWQSWIKCSIQLVQMDLLEELLNSLLADCLGQSSRDDISFWFVIGHYFAPACRIEDGMKPHLCMFGLRVGFWVPGQFNRNSTVSSPAPPRHEESVSGQMHRILLHRPVPHIRLRLRTGQ